MDRVAVISDVHGNHPALTAVLEDIDRRGISRIICLGDLVGKGPSGDSVIDVCRDRCESILQGNWDFMVADGENSHPSMRWHRQQIGRERLMLLQDLPFCTEILFSGQHIRLFHASPFGLFHRVFEQDPYEKQAAMFDSTELTGHDSTPDMVVYGDIHTAYLSTPGRRTLLNVGSVGNPLDLTLASYAIIEGIAGDQVSPIAITIVRLPYDIERAIAEATAADMPELDAYANELRTGRYRGSSA